MKIFQDDTRVYQLINLLNVAGEFPVSSLDLLGDKRCFRRLITELTQLQEFHNSKTGEKHSCVAISLSGKGKAKTIRLKKQAMPLLEWINGAKYYEDAFVSNHIGGGEQTIERNHRTAEVVAMMQGAGIEYLPWLMPILQMDFYQKENISEPVYYSSKAIKYAADDTPQFIGFTRFAGAFVTPTDCFTVYNVRDSVMKWGNAGEAKAYNIINRCMTLNSQTRKISKAILMGRDINTVINTITQTEKAEKVAVALNRQQSYKYHNSITSIYHSVYYVPLSNFGQKLLKILTVPDYHSKVLRLIYEEDELSKGTENFVYDAYRKNRHVLSFLDGDVTRLRQFKETIMYYQERGTSESYAVLCFKEQSEEITEYMSDCEDVNIQTVNINQVLDLLFEEE